MKTYKGGLDHLVKEAKWLLDNNKDATEFLYALSAYDIYRHDLKYYEKAPKYYTREEYLEWKLKQKNLKSEPLRKNVLNVTM